MRRLRSPLMLMAVAVFGAGILAQGPPAGAPQTPAPGAPPAPVAGAPADPAAGRQGGRGGGGGRGGRGVAVQPGQECPPGMTRSNPNSCSTPEFPVPSIVDYRPHSTLVAAEHKVPKAKYGAIDYHAHVTGAICPGKGWRPGRRRTTERHKSLHADALATLVKDLDSVGVALAVAADSVTGERLKQVLDVVRNSPHKDRVRVLTGINFSGVGPGWAEKAVAQLEADVKAGAVGIGEISKSLGLTDAESRRHAAEGGRPGARSGVGGRRAAEHPRLHSHRRAAGILPAARHAQRAMAGTGALCAIAATTCLAR